MGSKELAAAADTTTANVNGTDIALSSAKLRKSKQIIRVLEYFSIYVGSTLDCANATGILRNSICYHVSCLKKARMLGVVGRFRDKTTRRIVKLYSSNESLWIGSEGRKKETL